MASEPRSNPTSPPTSTETPPQRRGVKRAIALSLVVLCGLALGYAWRRGGRIDDRIYGVDDLRAGPISQIVTWDDSRTAVQISQLSSLPADELWRVATDQARFDEFMPYVRKTTVSPGPDGTLIEKQWLDLPHASYDLELTIRLTETANTRRAKWEQTKGTLSYNQGAWVVEKHGEQSILRYQVSASLTGVPQWIVNAAMRRRLGRLLDAVEARVRDLKQKEPGYFGTSS